MPVIACPRCSATCSVAHDAAGKRVQCPTCRQPFDVTVPTPTPISTPPPLPLPRSTWARDQDYRHERRPLGLAILPLVCWIILALFLGLLVMGAFAVRRENLNAIQHAAFFAELAFWAVLAYAGARAVDRATEIIRGRREAGLRE